MIPSSDLEPGLGAHPVRVEPGGRCFDVPAGLTLLAAAERAGLQLPRSCRNGSCRTCIARLREGRVAYRIAWPGLLAEEKAEGWILPCVAYAESALVLELGPAAGATLTDRRPDAASAP